MKHILLFLLFLPLQFVAQIQPESILPAYLAKSEKVKSVRATTLFFAPHANIPDTATVTIEEYDRNGNIVFRNYHNTLDKNNFTSRSEFLYTGEIKTAAMHYENGFITDSIIYISPTAYIRYLPAKNIFVRHEIKDSILTETIISGADTTIRKRKISPEKNFYDNDFYPGAYENKITVYDSIRKVDSSAFLNTKGKRILSIVNHYDSFNHLTETDYYNKKDRNYRIYAARYNSKMEMSIYMPTRKSSMTYKVIREYDTGGMMINKKLISSRKRDPVVQVNYVYSYY